MAIRKLEEATGEQIPSKTHIVIVAAASPAAAVTGSQERTSSMMRMVMVMVFSRSLMRLSIWRGPVVGMENVARLEGTCWSLPRDLCVDTCFRVQPMWRASYPWVTMVRWVCKCVHLLLGTCCYLVRLWYGHFWQSPHQGAVAPSVAFFHLSSHYAVQAHLAVPSPPKVGHPPKQTM